METIIANALEYAKNYFLNDFSGHDYFHTERVYNLTKYIANYETCNKKTAYLGSILHDVDDYKIVGFEVEPIHNAKTFLNSQNVSKEEIEQICHIISQVSFKGTDSVVPDTIEGKIVQDADRLDAIGAIGIARAFTYGGNHNMPIYLPDMAFKENMSAEEYYKNKGTTINHFYEKLLKLKDMMNTETAKKIAIHRHEYMLEFLKEFYDEWESNIKLDESKIISYKLGGKTWKK